MARRVSSVFFTAVRVRYIETPSQTKNVLRRSRKPALRNSSRKTGSRSPPRRSALRPAGTPSACRATMLPSAARGRVVYLEERPPRSAFAKRRPHSYPAPSRTTCSTFPRSARASASSM